MHAGKTVDSKGLKVQKRLKVEVSSRESVLQVERRLPALQVEHRLPALRTAEEAARGMRTDGWGRAAYLRVHPLDVRLQVTLLGERGGAQCAEVRPFPRVADHVGLQNHLLVEGLPTVCALVWPFTWATKATIKTPYTRVTPSPRSSNYAHEKLRINKTIPRAHRYLRSPAMSLLKLTSDGQRSRSHCLKISEPVIKAHNRKVYCVYVHSEIWRTDISDYVLPSSAQIRYTMW